MFPGEPDSQKPQSAPPSLCRADARAVKLKRDKYDATFSDYIRYRDGLKCRRCGAQFPGLTQGIHCAHIYSRGNKGIRTDPDNAVSLCNGCHRYFTKRSIEFLGWCEKTLGRAHMESLKAKYFQVRKITREEKDLQRSDLQARIEDYKERLAKLDTH